MSHIQTVFFFFLNRIDWRQMGSLLITSYFYCYSLTFFYLIKQPVWEIHFFRMADFSAQVPHAFISIYLFIRFLFQVLIPLCLLFAFSAEEVVGHLNISNFLAILKCFPLPLLTWKCWFSVYFSDSEDQRWRSGFNTRKN